MGENNPAIEEDKPEPEYRAWVYTFAANNVLSSQKKIDSVVVAVQSGLPQSQKLYIFERAANGAIVVGPPQITESGGISLDKMKDGRSLDRKKVGSYVYDTIDNLFKGNTQLNTPVDYKVGEFFLRTFHYDEPEPEPAYEEETVHAGKAAKTINRRTARAISHGKSAKSPRKAKKSQRKSG